MAFLVDWLRLPLYWSRRTGLTQMSHLRTGVTGTCHEGYSRASFQMYNSKTKERINQRNCQGFGCVTDWKFFRLFLAWGLYIDFIGFWQHNLGALCAAPTRHPSQSEDLICHALSRIQMLLRLQTNQKRVRMQKQYNMLRDSPRSPVAFWDVSCYSTLLAVSRVAMHPCLHVIIRTGLPGSKQWQRSKKKSA